MGKNPPFYWKSEIGGKLRFENLKKRKEKRKEEIGKGGRKQHVPITRRDWLKRDYEP